MHQFICNIWANNHHRLPTTILSYNLNFLQHKMTSVQWLLINNDHCFGSQGRLLDTGLTVLLKTSSNDPILDFTVFNNTHVWGMWLPFVVFPSWRSEVDFTSFFEHRSQKHKKTVKLSASFCAFGILAQKLLVRRWRFGLSIIVSKRSTITSLCLQCTMTQQHV